MSDKQDALEAAPQWLDLLSEGDYAGCWARASSLMRGAVSGDQLDQSLRAALTPMGAPGGRSVNSAEFHEILPETPDGKYWVVQFAAAYGNEKEAIETVMRAGVSWTAIDRSSWVDRGSCAM